MPTPVPLDNLLGATFIGIVLSTVLYGVSCLQTYLYYTQYCKNDSLRLKLFVALIVILDSLHVALISTTYYYYTVTNYGDYYMLERVTWSIVVQIAVGGLVGFLIQLFFARRLYMLGKRSLVIPSIVCLLGAVELGCSIVYTIVAFRDRYFSVGGEAGHADVYTSTALAANLLCDLLIAGATVRYLQAGRTVFRRTNKAVTLIMTYALSTCVLAMIFSIICLITWVTLNKTLIYAPFYFILVRIYPCSFLSTLNSREAVRRVFETEIPARELQSLGSHSDNQDKRQVQSKEDISGTRPSSSRCIIPSVQLDPCGHAQVVRISEHIIPSPTSTAV